MDNTRREVNAVLERLARMPQATAVPQLLVIVRTNGDHEVIGSERSSVWVYDEAGDGLQFLPTRIDGDRLDFEVGWMEREAKLSADQRTRAPIQAELAYDDREFEE